MEEKSWLVGLVSWFFPGAGHVMSGHWKRGFLIGGVVWLMFLVGMVGGGDGYPGHSFTDGMLLSLLNIFSRLGNGLGFLLSLITGSGKTSAAAASAIFEYSGRFLEVSGLLNYLAALDAFDLAQKRKQ